MSAESLVRLKEAVQGRPAVNQKKGRVQVVSAAEVMPIDVLNVCGMIEKPSKRVQDMLAGNADATEDSPSVHMHVSDLLHLIELAEKSE